MKSVSSIEMARPEDSRTLSDLAREALDVQNACNLSGVVLSFGRSIVRLRRLLESEGGGGTNETNQHPISQLWADKIASLTHTQWDNSWSSAAYRAVYEMAEPGREVSRARS